MASIKKGGRRTVEGQIRGGIESQTEQTSDITFMRYLRPLGNRGLHLVQPRGGGSAIHARGAGRLTYRPGQFVGVARHSGEGGHVIVSDAPPGSVGASDLQRLRIERTTEQVGCPPIVRNKFYLGVYEEFAASSVNPHRIHFYIYFDGELRQSLGYYEVPSGSTDDGFPIEIVDTWWPPTKALFEGIGEGGSDPLAEFSGPWVLARNGPLFFVLDIGRINAEPSIHNHWMINKILATTEPFTYIGSITGPPSFPPANGYLGRGAGEVYGGETVSNHPSYWTLGLTVGPGNRPGGVGGIPTTSSHTGGPSGKHLHNTLQGSEEIDFTFVEYSFKDRSVINQALPYTEFERDNPNVAQPSTGIPWRSALGFNYLLWRDLGGGTYEPWIATISSDNKSYKDEYRPDVEKGGLIRLVPRDLYMPGGALHDFYGDSIGYPVEGGALRVVGNQQEPARAGGLSASLKYVTFWPDDPNAFEYRVFEFSGSNAILHSTISPDGDLVFTVGDVSTEPPLTGGLARYSMPNVVPSDCGGAFIPCDVATIPPNPDADDPEREIVPSKFLPLN